MRTATTNKPTYETHGKARVYLASSPDAAAALAAWLAKKGK